MLIQIDPKLVINTDSIESIKEEATPNPDYIPSVKGIIEGNNLPAYFSKVIIRTNTGDVLILKNRTLEEIVEILKNSK
jgi:hypothetical protein